MEEARSELEEAKKEAETEKKQISEQATRHVGDLKNEMTPFYDSSVLFETFCKNADEYK